MYSFARNVLRPNLVQARGILPGSRALKHTLPPLPYAYDALEPYISKEIMTLHHTKHHQAYVTGLNAAEETYNATDSIAKKIALHGALKFNGGGHINHSLFWKNLAPAKKEGGKLVSGGELEKALAYNFESFEEFKKAMTTKTGAIQGSGWGWLGYEPASKRLEIVTTANQDPLLSHVPIVGIDIWEHAFYLQYKNVKPDYLAAIWNVINFEEAEKRLVAAMASK